jgi:hypothetical protein
MIQDPGWEKFGSRIRDQHPGSATLPFICGVFSDLRTKHMLLVQHLLKRFSLIEDKIFANLIRFFC